MAAVIEIPAPVAGGVGSAEIPGAVAPAAGGFATPWAPLVIDYATLEILDGFITGVTHHGDGEHTLNIDYTKSRTWAGNGDLSFQDVITEWSSLGSQDYMLEVKIEVINAPDKVTGTPFVAVYHRAGATARYTGSAAIASLVFHSSGTDRSIRMTSSLGQAVSADSSMGTPDTVVMGFKPPTGLRSNLRYGLHLKAQTTTDTGGITAWTRSDIVTTYTASIEGGYDIIGGSFLGLSFQQLSAQTGTGSARLKFTHRFVRIQDAESL